MQQTLYIVHYAMLTLFGVVLSFAFAGVSMRKKRNITILTIQYVLCAVPQLGLYLWTGEAFLWMVYPLIVHLPLVLTLSFMCEKHFITGAAAAATAYMCCQPAKWFGLLCTALGGSYELDMIVRIVTMVVVGVLCVKMIAPALAGIFNKAPLKALIFGIVPIVNYLFDYIVTIYTDIWQEHAQLAGEFTPFVLCVVFIVFSVVYYRQHEKRAEVLRRERLASIQVQQQTAHLEKVRKNEQLLHILRHDLRHFLNTLAACLENDDREKALELLRGYLEYTDKTTVKKYCDNDMVNYVLTDISAKCKKENVELYAIVELGQVEIDEILLCSLLSNLLENALYAQQLLAEGHSRQIRLMLKEVDGKLLVSVKNPVDREIEFEDGLPVADEEGHGVGTQSVRYIANYLKGNCQFFVKNGMFVARVII